MKTTALNSMMLGIALFFFACSNKNEDSKDLAKELNEQKFDTTEIENDTEFMVDAADNGSLEVELGKLAQINGSVQSIKDFGKSMVMDQAMANDELAKIAKQKNISLPIDLSNKKQKTLENFAAKKGRDFDKAYASFIVDDHKQDVKEFEQAVKDAKDPQIKKWAAARIPALQRHLAMVQALKDRVK